jgi:hypothetical protein
MMDFFDRLRQCASELRRAFTVVLQQVIRHALRRLGSDTGQAAQAVSEKIQAGRCFHWFLCIPQTGNAGASGRISALAPACRGKREK